MQPTSPIIPEFAQYEITIAKDQPEYTPLPVLAMHREQHGAIVSRWALSDEDRLAIAAGADIYLTQLTFGMPMQPIRLAVLNVSQPTHELVAGTTEGLVGE